MTIDEAIGGVGALFVALGLVVGGWLLTSGNIQERARRECRDMCSPATVARSMPNLCECNEPPRPDAGKWGDL